MAGTALYARPLRDALWTGAGDGSLLLLVAVALGLFALHALLDFGQSRELALLLRGDLEPGLFIAASLIGIAAMRSAARAAARWHGGRQAAMMLRIGRM